MIALSYLLLTLAAGSLCLWLWPRRQASRNGARGAITAALVALALVVLSSSLILAGLWFTEPAAVEHSQRIFGLAAQVMTLPLLGLASLSLARNRQWSPAVWGKIILGLMAFFELSRYLEQQLAYQWLVNLLGLAALLAATLPYWSRQRLIALLGLTSTISLLLPAWPAHVPLAALIDVDHRASWLLPGMVAAGLLLGLLSEQAHNKATAATADTGKEE